jgi:hypothetical protein
MLKPPVVALDNPPLFPSYGGLRGLCDSSFAIY